jgi:ketosteroid isomerase-like protein
MKRRTILIATAAYLMATPLWAADVAAPAPNATLAKEEDPAHEELRTLRKGLIEAIQKNDIDALLTYLDPDVLVTWPNGEVSRKPEGVKAYYDRMMKGPGRIVDSLTSDPTVDELAHLYGDTAISTGTSKDHYHLADGKDLDLLTHWTAAVVKKDGKWKITAFHGSVDMFDNAVLRLAISRVAWWAGGIAAVVGIIIGLIVARVFRKPPAAARL